jgi:hypothetical protein
VVGDFNRHACWNAHRTPQFPYVTPSFSESCLLCRNYVRAKAGACLKGSIGTFVQDCCDYTLLIGHMNVASPFRTSGEDLKTVKSRGNIKAVGAFLGKQGHQYVTISCGRDSKLPSSKLPPGPHCCSDAVQILWNPHWPPARGPIDIYPP